MNPKKKNITLFSGGLNPKTAPKDLEDFISKAGEVISVRMPKKKGQSRCIAFIDVKDSNTADVIIRYFQEQKRYLHERHITVAFSNQSEEDKQKKRRMRLCMKQIPTELTNQEIERCLVSKGLKVRSAYQIKTENGTPKGFGFIDFEGESDAQKMLKKGCFYLHGEKILLEAYQPKGKGSRLGRDTKTGSSSGQRSFGYNEGGERKPDSEISELGSRNFSNEQNPQQISFKKKSDCGVNLYKNMFKRSQTESFKMSKFAQKAEEEGTSNTKKASQRFSLQDSLFQIRNFQKRAIPIAEVKAHQYAPPLHSHYSKRSSIQSNLPSIDSFSIEKDIFIHNIESPLKMNRGSHQGNFGISGELPSIMDLNCYSNLTEPESTKLRTSSEPFFDQMASNPSGLLNIETIHRKREWPISEANSPLTKRRGASHICGSMDRLDGNNRMIIKMMPIPDMNENRVFSWGEVAKQAAEASKKACHDRDNLRLNRGSFPANSYSVW